MPRIEIPAFTGGLVTRVSEEDLKPNQLSEATNITISKTIGALETRRGLELWDSLSFLTTMNIFWQNIFTTSGMVVRSGEDLYVGTSVIKEDMTDAETIFETFDSWLVMVNGTENLKYKDTGMELRWNTGYCYTWEKDYVVAGMKATAKVTRISDETTYQCCHTWEVQMLDGETIEGTALMFYTSSSDVTTGSVYSDANDIIYLDCEETTGDAFISQTLKGLIFDTDYKAIDSNTKLFLTMDGSDESTTFIDTGSTVHTVTAEGGAQVDTAYKKAGTGSLLLDGVDSYLSIPDHADWTFGTNPFTIDFWVRPNFPEITTEYLYAFTQIADTNNRMLFGIYSTSLGQIYGIQFNYRVSGTFIINMSRSYPPIYNQSWHHVALIRGWGGVNDSWAFCIDGVLFGEVEENSSNLTDLGAPVEIGRYSVSPYYYIPAHIDNMRVTKGEALWTRDFVPVIGATSHTSSTKKYGDQSLRISEKGGVIHSPGGASFEVVASDFTLAFFLKLDADDVDSVICEQKNTTDGFRLWYDADGGASGGAFVYNMYVGGVTYIAQYDVTPSTASWYHVAVIRGWGGNNNQIVVCVDGVPGDVATAYDMASGVQSEIFFIGGRDTDGFKGYIDEPRFTTEALWTSQFTPPASAYSPSTTTVSDRDINFPVQLGIDPPTAVCTAVDAAVGGNPDGTYSYKVTFLSGRGSESNAYDASDDVVVDTNQITVGSIPISDDSQVTQRRLYRTEDGGTTYLLLATIDNNYDETYTDNIADTSLGAVLATDNEVPPALSYIKEHQGLLYGVNASEKNKVHYCNQFNELDSWNDTNYETFGSGDATSYALDSFGRYLVVLQEASLWTYNTVEDVVERSFTNQGIFGSQALLNIGDGVIYADAIAMNIYTTIAYDTIRSVPVHGMIGDIFDYESDNPNRIHPDYIGNMCIGGIGNDVLISYTRQGQTTNDRTIHYNRETKKIETIINKGFVCFASDKESKDIYGGATDGYIYKVLTGTTDNEVAIDWTISTKDFAKEFGSVVAKKQGGWFFLDVNPGGTEISIGVYYDDSLVKTFTTSEASRYILRKKLPLPTSWNRIRFDLSGSGKQYLYGLAFDGELLQRKERENEIQR